MNYESIVSELKQLKPVSINAISELIENQDVLISIVNNRIINSEPTIADNWSRFCKTISKDQFMHINFMAQVFRFSAFESLLKTQTWLSKVYSVNKLPQEFIIQLNRFWLEAIEQTMPTASAEPITQLYTWLINNHDRITSTPVYYAEHGIIFDESLNRLREDLLVYLVIGDFFKCLSISSEFVTGVNDLFNFYLQILQPCMYEVGYMWENGEITTAQEHLASSIVNRIMSYIYTKLNMVTNVSNKVVVTTPQGEFHELGARMVADFLEIYGWKVRFLGANTPTESLIDLINKENPDILSLSVTMFYNLKNTQDLIVEVKEKCWNKNLKIIVGGQAFQMEPNIWKDIGADGYTKDAREAVALARQLTHHSK